MKNKICIVFDLDGTLIHTAPALTRAGNTLLAELGLKGVTVENYSKFIGGGIPKQVEKLLEFSNYRLTKPLDKYVEIFKESYYRDPLIETSAYPKVAEALQELTSQYRDLAICTQKNELPARFILEKFDLLKEF